MMTKAQGSCLGCASEAIYTARRHAEQSGGKVGEALLEKDFRDQVHPSRLWFAPLASRHSMNICSVYSCLRVAWKRDEERGGKGAVEVSRGE